MMTSEIKDRAARWLDVALPLWCDVGQASNGAFYESLDTTAKPTQTSWMRLRVQARQIYVYARAAATKRYATAGAYAQRGFNFLLATRADAPCYASRLTLRGGIAEDCIELYDQAFVLLACAAMITLGDTRAQKEAHRLCLVLDQAFAQKSGYADALPARPYYRQNPHMHLFEAFLALGVATGLDSYFARARAILELFTQQFFDSTTGHLYEVFDRQWRPQHKAPLEPGHFYEWVYLLHLWARLTKTKLSPDAARLFDWAQAHGRDVQGVALHGVADAAPLPADVPYARLWQQTEMLRATQICAPNHVMAIMDMLWSKWFNTQCAGLWWDCWPSAAGPAMQQQVPASTFYHIWGALALLSQDEELP